ncbi:MAG: hypothetical protein K0Q50_1349 [Vampirovibrio sp.]|jgi:hypothetical protein|nr:hypothetical protein [Vampirovibrio sp.]
MIKGKNQHVMPDSQGWCVIDEANLMVIQHFDNQEQALSYANQCALMVEGEVLVHATSCDPTELSTVPLPQREFIPNKGDASPSINASSSAPNKEQSDFDPLLGYDEYYFEI